jgi:hypothetical protein
MPIPEPVRPEDMAHCPECGVEEGFLHKESCSKAGYYVIVNVSEIKTADELKIPDATPVLERTLKEGAKFDQGKNQLGLWSPYAIIETGKVLTFGAAKYEPHNWAKGIKYSRVYDALQRHLLSFWLSDNLDEETRLHHLAHGMCCLMFLLHYEVSPRDYSEFDDRPNYG